MNLSSQYVILIDICLWTVLYVQNLFLLFCYYLPLEKRVALLLAHHTTMIVPIQVWLILV